MLSEEVSNCYCALCLLALLTTASIFRVEKHTEQGNSNLLLAVYLLGFIFYPEDGGGTLLWNVGKFQPDCKAPRLIRQYISLPWEHQIPHILKSKAHITIFCFLLPLFRRRGIHVFLIRDNFKLFIIGFYHQWFVTHIQSNLLCFIDLLMKYLGFSCGDSEIHFAFA